MKLKSVDIWNMHNVKNKHVDISDKNMLVGRNGSGKSTVLNAIQIALLGYIPGTNKQNKDIFNHASASPMKVMVTFDNGYYICRTYTKQKTTVKCDVDMFPAELDPKSIIANLELPIFNFNEFLSLSPNMLKDRLMELLPKTEEDINIQSKISDELSKLSAETRNLITSEMSANFNHDDILSEIKHLHKYTKDIISFKQSEIKRLISTIESSVQYNDVDNSYVLDEIISKIEQYKQMKCAINETNRCNALIHSIELQLSDISKLAPKESESTDDRYIEWNFERNCYDNQLMKLKQNIRDADSKISELKFQHNNIAQNIASSNICPILKTKCDNLLNEQSKLNEQIESIDDELSSAQLTRADLDDQMNDLSYRIDKLNININKLIQHYNTKRMLIQQLESIKSKMPDEYTVTNLTVEFIDSELDKLDSIRIKLLANLEYDKIMTKVVKDKAQAELDLSVLKVIADKLGPNGLQADVSSAPFAAAESIISDKLKECGLSGDAHFTVDGGNNSFDFGFIQNNHYISYKSLSSGEKCLYMLAFMSALLSMNDCKIKLLLLDDVFDHLDNDHTAKALDFIENADDTQYVIAGVNDVFETCESNNLNVINMR